MAFDYATIVAGRVTAVTLAAGSIPASDATTYYHEIRSGETVPSVDDYFTEPCNLFSATQPVIPPGDIAPPFPPGTTPPDPGGDDYPDYDDPVNDVGPTPPPVVVPSLITFHANDVDTLTVTVPSTRTELPDLTRTAFDFSRACSFRLQAWIETEVAAGRIAAEWYNETALAWQPMDGGLIGPILEINLAGYSRGPLQSPSDALAAQGDAIIRLVAEAGTNGSLVLGNVGMLVYSNTGAGGPCVALPPWEYPCDYSGALSYWNNAGLADTAALIAAINAQNFTGPPLIYYSLNDVDGITLDTVNTYNGNPSARLRIGTVDNAGPIANWDGTFAASYEDATFYMHFELEACANDNAGTNQGGTVIFEDFHQNATQSGTGQEIGLYIRNTGRVELNWNAGGGTFGNVDIGPASDWIGTELAFTWRTKRLNTTDMRVDIYLNTPCDDPVLYHTETITSLNTTGGSYGHARWLLRSGTQTPDPTYVNEYELAWDTDPTVFGLTL